MVISADFIFGEYVLKVESELGGGYSGIVYLVRDQSGRSYALKVSKSQNNDRLHECLKKEYNKLLYLSERKNIRVPKVFGLYSWVSATAMSQTAILMERAPGMTLREWINAAKEDSYMDPICGRTIHPVFSRSEATRRIQCAIAIAETLCKLRSCGNFVDLKPRNLMIDDRGNSISCTLVDAGGILLYDSVKEWKKTGLVDPTEFRHYMETTSSYISPEIATIITENDISKEKIGNHLKTANYEDFSDISDIYDLIAANLMKKRILTPSGHVPFREASTSFVLGLIFVEIFGGHRTGVTAATRLPEIQSMFGKTSELEFRCLLEWDFFIPALGDSYQNFYRSNCYPQQGFFSASSGTVLGTEVTALLDACLDMNPSSRPLLHEIVQQLKFLKDEVMLCSEPLSFAPRNENNGNDVKSQDQSRRTRSSVRESLSGMSQRKYGFN